MHLVGLTEGLVPITYAETDEQLEEERRLLYVGVTRARERLKLSWALARAPGGRAGRRPSRFLDSLREARAAMVDAGAGGVVRRGSGRGPQEQGKSKRSGPVRCRVCGKALIEAVDRKLGRCADCPSHIDLALFQRLRDWRAERAKEQSLPAYVVFTDATLTAIAETQPADRASLARIPGVGSAKLERYAEQVLTILTGAGPTPTSDDVSDGVSDDVSGDGQHESDDEQHEEDQGSDD